MSSTVAVAAESAPAPASVPPVTPPPPRMVAALVQGVEIQVPCPPWCVVADHATEDLIDIVDLVHEGAVLSLAVPGAAGEAAMSVRLASYPFDREPSEREPHLLLTAPSGNLVSLPAALAESVARGIEEHAAALRAMAGVL